MPSSLQTTFAAVLALPLLMQTAAAQDTAVPDPVQESCQDMASERCLIDSYEAVVNFSVDQMSALYHRDGFDPEAELDILDRNNLSTHWHACTPISGYSQFRSPEGHLGAPMYCLSAVEDFAAKFGGSYDEEGLNQWMAHLQNLRTLHESLPDPDLSQPRAPQTAPEPKRFDI